MHKNDFRFNHQANVRHWLVWTEKRNERRDGKKEGRKQDIQHKWLLCHPLLPICLNKEGKKCILIKFTSLKLLGACRTTQSKGNSENKVSCSFYINMSMTMPLKAVLYFTSHFWHWYWMDITWSNNKINITKLHVHGKSESGDFFFCHFSSHTNFPALLLKTCPL